MGLVLVGCDGEPHQQAAAATRVPMSEGCTDETLARHASVIDWHAARYPDLDAQDLYKLLHQAVAGPAHAIEEPEMARRWLEREWEGLGDPLAGEDLFEPLSADGQLVRVNLRPWRAAGQDPEPVLNAFVRTANALPPDTARIRAELDAVAACAERLSNGLTPTADSIRAYFAARAAEGYPAVHHSEPYSAVYRPAYRVVLRSFLD